MKIQLFVLSILLWLAIGPRAEAQNTAFTYNGRLAMDGGPVSGNYDLRFLLFDDPAAGNLIGSVTNLFAGLTNGVFITTLDFGNVFSGTNYWLEIGVRTNGGSDFTVLTPRQPIMPVPYAMYANYAGAVDGAGPLAEWSGIGTNAFFGQMTNWATTTLGPMTSSNSVNAAASLVVSNYPWIQYSPPFAAGSLVQKLSTNGQVTVLMIGDSLTARPGSMMYAFISALKARYGDAGHGPQAFANLAGYSPPYSNPSPFPDGVMFGPGVVLKPGDYAFSLQPSQMPCDKVTLYWMGQTNGGDFQVVFSNKIVGYITNTLNGRVAGYGRLFATNFPGAFAVENRFTVTGLTGTNVIVGMSYVNSRQPGIIDFDFSRAGTTLPEYFALVTNAGFQYPTIQFPVELPSGNALADVARIVKPDLIVYCARDATEVTSNVWMPSANQLFSILQTNAHGLDTPVIIVGIYPELDFHGLLPPPTNTFESNLLKYQLARDHASNNWYYADIYDYFPSWQQNFDTGLMDDLLHCSFQGGIVFGDLLAKTLGLDPALIEPVPTMPVQSGEPLFFAAMSEGTGAYTSGYGKSNYPAAIAPMTWTTDPVVGNALSTSSLWALNFGELVELDGLLQMTVLAWVKPVANSFSGDAVIIGQWDDGGRGAWQLICKPVPSTTNPSLAVNWYDYQGVFHQYTGQAMPQLFDGNWHLIGFTYSVIDGALHLSVDGLDCGTYTGVMPSQICRANLIAGSFRGGPTLQGEYAGVAVYDHALSAREISNLYNAGTSRSVALALAGLQNSGGIFTNGFGTFTNGLTSLRNNLAAPVPVTIGKSPFSWTNNTGANIFVFVDGGSGSAIQINGTTVFQTFTGGHTIPLQPKEYVTLIYGTAPKSMFWKPQ